MSRMRVSGSAGAPKSVPEVGLQGKLGFSHFCQRTPIFGFPRMSMRTRVPFRSCCLRSSLRSSGTAYVSSVGLDEGIAIKKNRESVSVLGTLFVLETSPVVETSLLVESPSLRENGVSESGKLLFVCASSVTTGPWESDDGSGTGLFCAIFNRHIAGRLETKASKRINPCRNRSHSLILMGL